MGLKKYLRRVKIGATHLAGDAFLGGEETERNFLPPGTASLHFINSSQHKHEIILHSKNQTVKNENRK
jgi:hypothetical protein